MAWNYVKSQGNLPKIAICLPHTGDVSMEWVMRTWGPLMFKESTWCNKHAFFSRGPPIDVAREELVQQALEWGTDYVFFIDSDVIPELPDDINLMLYKLYSHNMPIISGMYRAKKANYNPWAMWTFIDKDNGFRPIDKWQADLLEVDVVGLGCCLIKREVFDNTERPWFRWEGKFMPSEDFYFLMKARTSGYKTIVDTRLRCSHIATLKIMPGDTPSYRTPL